MPQDLPLIPEWSWAKRAISNTASVALPYSSSIKILATVGRLNAAMVITMMIAIMSSIKVNPEDALMELVIAGRLFLHKGSTFHQTSSITTIVRHIIHSAHDLYT
tara:strand:- start:57 stop:371 length:315 start_codon:yes stop_codon:yes gene_type:complete